MTFYYENEENMLSNCIKNSYITAYLQFMVQLQIAKMRNEQQQKEGIIGIFYYEGQTKLSLFQFHRRNTNSSFYILEPSLPNVTSVLLINEFMIHTDKSTLQLMINSKKVIIIAIVVAVSLGCTDGVTSNGTSCPSRCIACTDNLTCTSCCGRYYVTPWGICQSCHDSKCYRCTAYNHNDSSCTHCQTYYALASTTPNTCTTCSSTNAIECESVNNCNASGSGCLDCNLNYFVQNNQCQKCNVAFQNCVRCNITHCLSCSHPYDVNISNYKQCVLCSGIPHCFNCQNGPKCIQCDSGYYLNSGVCLECRYPCITCDSATLCISCDTTLSQYIYNGSNCLPCQQFPNTSNCTHCQQTIIISAGGLNTVTYTCSACLAGFYFDNNQCSLCIAECLTCSSATNCDQCINITYALSASTCQLCNLIINNCTLCFSASICIECQAEFYLDASAACTLCNLTFPYCSSCDIFNCSSCQVGFILNSTKQCNSIFCLPPCRNCKTNYASECYDCLNGYFFNTSANNTCSLCLEGCLLCISDVNCSYCTINYYNNNGICQLCPITSYWSQHGDICYPCPAHCLTCDLNDCMTCGQLFQLIKQNGITLCLDTCGDGLSIENQCDIVKDGLKDGCSDQCTIQSNFNCTHSATTYNASNGTVMSLNASVCHYIGQVTITLTESIQIMLSNTVKVVFTIQPYLSGMPRSSDQQNYIQSIFSLSASSVNLSDYTVQIDQGQGTVSFIVNYDQDLSSSDLILNINFDTLSLVSPVLQYMTNTSHTISVSSMKQNGCFGQYFSQDELTNSKIIYYGSLICSLIGLFLFALGAFTKQLAGFEQIILYQTIFSLILFSEQKVNLAMLSFRGFRYALGIKLPLQSTTQASTSNYILQTDGNTFFSFYFINFALYVLPLIALIFLLYKLYYKTFPFKLERGRIIEQFLRGQVLLYLCLFNLFPLVVYSTLFLSTNNGYFFQDMMLIIISILVTFYAFFNFITKPEIVGSFRSAFRAFGSSKQSNLGRANCSCLTRKFFQDSLGEFYIKFTPNFYYIFICYMIASSLLIVLNVNSGYIILGSIQLLVLLILVMTKPYFNKLQKFRSMLTFAIFILANFITVDIGGQFTIPLALIGLCSVHLLLVGVILIMSFIQQIQRKCNDRSEVVKRMFKVEEQLRAPDNNEKEMIEKFMITEMIERFNLIQERKMYPQQSQYNQPLKNVREKDQNSEDHALKEDVILEEEDAYLRYQRGLGFFDMYGKQLEHELIKDHYDDIR